MASFMVLVLCYNAWKMKKFEEENEKEKTAEPRREKVVITMPAAVLLLALLMSPVALWRQIVSLQGKVYIWSATLMSSSKQPEIARLARSSSSVVLCMAI